MAVEITFTVRVQPDLTDPEFKAKQLAEVLKIVRNEIKSALDSVEYIDRVVVSNGAVEHL